MASTVQLLLLFLAQSTVPREVLQLAKIQRGVAAELAKLPDYTCVETIHRSLGRGEQRKVRFVDTLKLDVAFIGDKEVYGIHGSGSIDESVPGQFTRWGVTSNGEFAGQGRNLFVNRSAITRYAGPETLGRRHTLRWNFVTPYLSSGWKLQYADQLTRVSSKGSFWVDSKTLDLLQVDEEATEIDPKFPITSAHMSIVYGRVPLGGRRALIPVSTVLMLHEINGDMYINATRFSECKEYRAESAIVFDSEDSIKKD